MIKYLSALALVALLSACSGDSNPDSGTTGNTTGTTTGNTAGNTAGTTDGATTGNTGGTTGDNTGGTTGIDTGGDPVAPSGNIVGAWYGRNNFGEGVMIVNDSQNVYSLASNGVGGYETVFGPASGQLQHFFHRDSENSASADSFTLVGDRPSNQTPVVAEDTIAYNLSVTNDGQQIDHTGAGGDFSMTFATANDLPPITLASIEGSWSAKTSFCAVDCNLSLEMTFSAAGGVSGGTRFNDGDPITLAGNAVAAPGASQYLNVSFVWNGVGRNGVLHFDRNDSSRLIVNTFGPDDATGATSSSFTARMIKQ